MLKFINDPIVFIFESFESLFPELPVNIQFVNDLDGAGRTTFPDNGGIPLIDISTTIPISALPEILSHELAHIARPNDIDHGIEWEGAFNLIFTVSKHLYSKEHTNFQQTYFFYKNGGDTSE